MKDADSKVPAESGRDVCLAVGEQGEGRKRRGCGSCIFGLVCGVAAIVCVVVIANCYRAWKERMAEQARAGSVRVREVAIRAINGGDEPLPAWLNASGVKLGAPMFPHCQDGIRARGTVLSLAVMEGKCVQVLLDLGADPDKGFRTFRDGWLGREFDSDCMETPLETAVIHRRPDAIRRLLAAGAELHPGGRNPLFLVFEDTCPPQPVDGLRQRVPWRTEEALVLDALLTRYSIDARGSGGGTLLMKAAELGIEAAVSNMIALGADPTLKNDEGKTAYQIADEQRVHAVSRDPALKIGAAFSFGISVLLADTTMGRGPMLAMLKQAEEDWTKRHRSAEVRSEHDGR